MNKVQSVTRPKPELMLTLPLEQKKDNDTQSFFSLAKTTTNGGLDLMTREHVTGITTKY
jgi:hypothetical protein